MSIDALFQLGIVSVSLNTSQKEELFSRHARRTGAHPRTLLPDANAAARRWLARFGTPLLLHPLQAHVSNGRTPA